MAINLDNVLKYKKRIIEMVGVTTLICVIALALMPEKNPLLDKQEVAMRNLWYVFTDRKQDLEVRQKAITALGSLIEYNDTSGDSSWLPTMEQLDIAVSHYHLDVALERVKPILQAVQEEASIEAYDDLEQHLVREPKLYELLKITPEDMMVYKDHIYRGAAFAMYDQMKKQGDFDRYHTVVALFGEIAVDPIATLDITNHEHDVYLNWRLIVNFKSACAGGHVRDCVRYRDELRDLDIPLASQIFGLSDERRQEIQRLIAPGRVKDTIAQSDNMVSNPVNYNLGYFGPDSSDSFVRRALEQQVELRKLERQLKYR